MKTEKKLHIICLNVPYPADYGGVIDIFNKIVTLHERGIRLHLHCFEYGRGEQPALEQYCERIHYYPRQTGHRGISTTLPYIVGSRSSEELANRLLEDDDPILMEGIHCTHLANDPRFKGRKMIVRLHNVEYLYYRHLAKTESSFWKKIFFHRESRLLKKYEQKLAGEWPLAAISPNDMETYRQLNHSAQLTWVPAFHSFREVESLPGKGCFCLYHGDLSVPENEKAAAWLLEEVFSRISTPLVLAGRHPSARLLRLAHRQLNTCLVADPSDQELLDMIRKAQINLVPSFHPTGTKLKLLHSLYAGRHCIANEAAIGQTGLGELCHIASDAAGFRDLVLRLYDQPFSGEEAEKRKSTLQEKADRHMAAERLIQMIW